MFLKVVSCEFPCFFVVHMSLASNLLYVALLMCCSVCFPVLSGIMKGGCLP